MGKIGGFDNRKLTTLSSSSPGKMVWTDQPFTREEKEVLKMDQYELIRTGFRFWLKSDRDKPRKQRHTAHRVSNRLVEEHGYSGSESGVRRHVRMAKMLLWVGTLRAFIPCDPEAGSDWNLSQLYDEEKAYLLTLAGVGFSNVPLCVNWFDASESE